MRPVLAWPDWSDSCAITGSTALTGCPLANLKTKQPKQVWASANVSSAVYMELDRGATVYPWNTVAIISANATKDATWWVRAATSQAGLTSGPEYKWGSCLVLNGSTQYASRTFTSTGTITGLTFIVRCRADTLRVQGIARLWGASSGFSIEMNASNKIIVDSSSGTTMTGASALVANEWVHVAVVLSTGSVAYLYINGVLVDTGTGWTSQAYQEITFGHEITNRLSGRVDDGQFWTRALTAEEILADFEHAGTRTTPQADLHSYYTFDGTTGNDGYDGASLTYTGSPAYGPGARFTASPWSRLPGANRRSSLLWVPAGVNYRWLRIDIDDPTNADTVFEAGRLVVGNGWQFIPTYPGNLPSFTDETQVEILPGGQSAINASTPVPTATVNLRATTEAELLTYLYEIAARRGSSKRSGSGTHSRRIA